MKKDITDLKASEAVPNDIIEEKILEHFPQKSLCRFKSVSKQWKTMIESSYLTRKRLVRYPNPKLLVLRSEISSDRCSRTIFLETISNDDHDHNKFSICSYNFLSDPQNEFHLNNVFQITGYCNGLVCINESEHIYIVNPTTRNFRILSRVVLESTCLPDGKRILPINVGFGKDIVTGSYKIVLMYPFEHISRNTLAKTEVFNLSNGKQKLICFPFYYEELGNDKTSTFVNGSLYWLNNYHFKITTLDLHTEMFSKGPTPSCYTYSHARGLILWSLKDRLCISNVLQYPDVDIWGLKHEDPKVMKWEKILSVTILSLDCLEANFWKLGLAACKIRPMDNKPLKNFLEQVPEDNCSTVLYMEDLVSSV